MRRWKMAENINSIHKVLHATAIFFTEIHSVNYNYAVFCCRVVVTEVISALSPKVQLVKS